MFSLLADFDPATFIQKLTEDPASYARILNALSKITEEALKYQRVRAEEEHRKARLQKEAADEKNLGLSPATRRQIEEEFNII